MRTTKTSTMRRITLSASALLAVGTAMPALAHTQGAETASLLAGLLHPLTGVDHLLAMLAVGIWMAAQKKAQMQAIPTAFMAALLVGFMLGLNGFNLPLVEGGIASSVLVLGLLIAAAVKLPTIAAASLAAMFALFHGFAHGTEITGTATAIFAAGFMFSSAVLITAGKLSATVLHTQLPAVTKLIGLMIAMTGGLLIAG